jgi:hypothetical protein
MGILKNFLRSGNTGVCIIRCGVCSYAGVFEGVAGLYFWILSRYVFNPSCFQSKTVYSGKYTKILPVVTKYVSKSETNQKERIILFFPCYTGNIVEIVDGSCQKMGIRSRAKSF